MKLNVGVIMDPISGISVKKDTTLAILLEAQKREHSIYYMEQKDLIFSEGRVKAYMRELEVWDDENKWYSFNSGNDKLLSDLDVIFMRKDPPFDLEYIYTTYLLDHAENDGVLVVNKPQSLRDANEKIFTTWFPQCTPPTIVTRNIDNLNLFLNEHEEIVVKPLGLMGGVNVFRIKKGEPNTNVILEAITELESRTIIAQRFIPEITSGGDKRIIIVDGEIVPFALARIPREGDTRGNLAAGAKGHAVELSDRDRWIAEQVAPLLKEKGLLFTGLDVIGDYLTEINVTSPTCIRELDRLCGLNIAGMLMDAVERKALA